MLYTCLGYLYDEQSGFLIATLPKRWSKLWGPAWLASK
jgi:hypothetical protein